MTERKIIIQYLTPIASSITVSVGFVALFMKSGLIKSLPPTIGGEIYDQVAWTLSLTLLGLFGVTFLYWLITRKKDFELRVLLALAVAPTVAILVIILSQTVLMILAKTISSLMAAIIVLISLYVAVFSVIFVLSNAFSTRIRNLVFIIYGALLGSFISLLLPTASLVTLLVSVAIYDLVMLNSDWFSELINVLSQSQRVGPRLSYFGDEIEIGIGELIFYSFIPAHVEAYYGLDLLVITLIMTGIGVMLNLWILEKRGFIAGLPAPILLGLTPLIIRFLLG
ncbi:hypothetical protein E2P71_06985 [Candidatus Bathyarchaeota archaeon]|nr:hypothetical protein E2P71_06985 [Candidatus Bathyarchaeota archaeon]